MPLVILHTLFPILEARPYLAEVFPHHLDEIRHGKVHDVVPPCRLQHHIRPEQVVAGKEAGSETLLLILLKEPLQQLLGQLYVLRLRCILHGILGRRTCAAVMNQISCTFTNNMTEIKPRRPPHLVELVFLAQLHTLLPSVVAFEEVSSDSPELNQLVLLQTLGQRDVVEVIVCIYRCPECLRTGQINSR